MKKSVSFQISRESSPKRKDTPEVNPADDNTKLKFNLQEVNHEGEEFPVMSTFPSRYEKIESENKIQQRFKRQQPKNFPNHGIIGSNPPAWLDLGTLHRAEQGTQNPVNFNHQKRKLDLELISMPSSACCNSSLCSGKDHKELLEILQREKCKDWNEGRKTSEVYTEKCPKMPDRFDNPSWFKGYGQDKKAHPLYTTTSSQYGLYPPNVHTMPMKYCPQKNIFSEHLTATGMGRNRSLNLK